MLDSNQVIGPRSYEARIVDDPRQGGKTSNEVQTILDEEPLDVLHDSTTLNNLVSPNEADIINEDEDHERNYNHQKAVNFIESDNDINPA